MARKVPKNFFYHSRKSPPRKYATTLDIIVNKSTFHILKVNP